MSEEHTDQVDPEIGTYRIMEDLEDRSRGWPWRYRVERFVEGGRFLLWSWGPKWQIWRDNLQLHEAQKLIEFFKKGVFEAEVVGSRVPGGNRP